MGIPAKWAKFVSECAKTYVDKRAMEPQIARRLVAHIKHSVPEEHAEEALFAFREKMQEVKRSSGTKKPDAAPKRKGSKADAAPKRRGSKANKAAAPPPSPAKRRGTPPPASGILDSACAAEGDSPPPPSCEAAHELDDDEDVIEVAVSEEETDTGDVDSDGAADAADEYEEAFSKGRITAEEYSEIRLRQQDERRNKIAWTLQTGDTDDEEDELFDIRIEATRRMIARKREQLSEIEGEIRAGGQSKTKIKALEAWAKRLRGEIKLRESEL